MCNRTHTFTSICPGPKERRKEGWQAGLAACGFVAAHLRGCLGEADKKATQSQ